MLWLRRCSINRVTLSPLDSLGATLPTGSANIYQSTKGDIKRTEPQNITIGYFFLFLVECWIRDPFPDLSPTAFYRIFSVWFFLLSYLKYGTGKDCAGQSIVILWLQRCSIDRLLSPVGNFGATLPTGSVNNRPWFKSWHRKSKKENCVFRLNVGIENSILIRIIRTYFIFIHVYCVDALIACRINLPWNSGQEMIELDKLEWCYHLNDLQLIEAYRELLALDRRSRQALKIHQQNVIRENCTNKATVFDGPSELISCFVWMLE